MTAHVLVPAGYATRASGGNVYDRRVAAGLVGLGWDLVVHEVGPAGPLPTLPADALVLVDSLVVSWHAEALVARVAGGVRVVPLVHMVFRAPGEHALLAAAPAVVTTSGWTKRWLVEAGLAADRVHVAVPGVDVADPVADGASGGSLLCVAPVVPAKGLDVLVTALTVLADRDWRCTVVGSVDDDPDFADEVLKAAADGGVADRLVLVGELDHDRVRAAYAAADLVVAPTRAETYGMVVSEALAHGLPVVASAVGGVPEALGHADDGSTPGVLVRPDDPGALAEALRRWLDDPRRRRRLQRSARSRRLSLPTWSRTTAQVAAALESAREAAR